MDGAGKALGKVVRGLGIGGMKKVGDRKCEHCGKVVPIYEVEKVDDDGNKTGELETVSTCLNCDNWQLAKELRKNRISDEELERRKTLKFALKYDKPPHDLIDKTLATYVPDNEQEEKIYQAARRYIDNFGDWEKQKYKSLIFRGTMGLGKSLIAHSIKDELKAQEKASMFLTTEDLLILVKSTFDKESDLHEDDVYERIGKLDFFVLDEVGAEYIKKKDEEQSFATKVLLKVINSRQNKPTIYTTNYKSSQLVDKYGEIQGGQIVSRMGYGAKPIVFEGKDRRIPEF